jgi:hypothetical protein
VIWWIVPGDFYRASKTLDKPVFVNINEVEKVCRCSHDETDDKRTEPIRNMPCYPPVHDYIHAHLPRYSLPRWSRRIRIRMETHAQPDSYMSKIITSSSAESSRQASLSPLASTSRVASRLAQRHSRTRSRVFDTTVLSCRMYAACFPFCM